MHEMSMQYLKRKLDIWQRNDARISSSFKHCYGVEFFIFYLQNKTELL